MVKKILSIPLKTIVFGLKVTWALILIGFGIILAPLWVVCFVALALVAAILILIPLLPLLFI